MLNTEQSRAGAAACLNAMQIIERIENRPGSDNTVNDWYRDKEAAMNAMILAAGEQSDFVKGFIAACAEYVSIVESSGTPDPYVWKPQASMTEEEKAADRAKTEAAVAE
jgi:hypothetical protein